MKGGRARGVAALEVGIAVEVVKRMGPIGLMGLMRCANGTNLLRFYWA